MPWKVTTWNTEKRKRKARMSQTSMLPRHPQISTSLPSSNSLKRIKHCSKVSPNRKMVPQINTMTNYKMAREQLRWGSRKWVTRGKKQSSATRVEKQRNSSMRQSQRKLRSNFRVWGILMAGILPLWIQIIKMAYSDALKWARGRGQPTSSTTRHITTAHSTTWTVMAPKTSRSKAIRGLSKT